MAGQRGQLFRPFTGRLHCGRNRSSRNSSPMALFRPFTGRLHCGRAIAIVVLSTSTCSGHSLAGSLRRWLADNPDRKWSVCSGHSLAGSLRPAGHCGVHGGSDAVPAIHWPAHCGQVSQGLGYPIRMLFRPFTGRLHCGCSTWARASVLSTAVPAIHWPAPLRRSRSHRRRGCLPAVPAIHWPAHCGGIPMEGFTYFFTLFRPFTGRLHCGWRDCPVMRAGRSTCSGHSLAGSIAARCPR